MLSLAQTGRLLSSLVRIFAVAAVFLCLLGSVSNVSAQRPLDANGNPIPDANDNRPNQPDPAAGQDQGRQPAVPPRPAPVARPAPGEPRDFVITGTLPACFQRGASLVFSGRDLDQLRGKSLSLRFKNRKSFELRQDSVASNLLVTRLPNAFWTEKLSGYASLLVEGVATRHGLDVVLCDEQDRPAGELVILFEGSADFGKLQAELRDDFGLQTLSAEFLDILELSLLRLKTPEGWDLPQLEALKKRYPRAVVDLNDDLEEAARPRVYSRKVLGWDESCAGNLTEQDWTNFSVAVIDGAVKSNHPAFKGQRIVQRSFLDKVDRPEEQHGTAIASLLIGANPVQGYNGLIRGVTLYQGVVVRKSIAGFKTKGGARVSAIVPALNWALKQKVRLINLSLVTQKNNGVLSKSVGRAVAKGALIFAAVGNNRQRDRDFYPAAQNGVFAVSAIDALKRPYAYANQGGFVDFTAPGVDLWVASAKGGGVYSSGTSFASPLAMAVGAQMLLRNRKLSRSLLYQLMKSRVVDLGKAGKDNTFGLGLVTPGC
ncbi:S8 family serine peptidase [Kiloniella sp. b19]|uniref:S8 family serine peptidase n=1 Tax=Kiloniella sp. GXU_MW_B19 TaxID=3141326 RepID=UPI0031E2EC4A